MNERLITLTLTAGETGTTLGANFIYMGIPIGATIVAVTASPNVDDAGLTIDVNNAGTELIAGVDCSDQNVPGSWISTHLGGTNTPVRIAADTVLNLDANNAAANTMVNVVIWMLVGEAS